MVICQPSSTFLLKSRICWVSCYITQEPETITGEMEFTQGTRVPSSLFLKPWITGRIDCWALGGTGAMPRTREGLTAGEARKQVLSTHWGWGAFALMPD